MFENLNTILVGGIAVGFFTAAMFFFRFWKQTGDRLFLFFGCAFLVMCCSRLMLSLGSDEIKTYIYLVRLFAFLLILTGIVQKNLPQKR
jgi:uncharacterized membrane protein